MRALAVTLAVVALMLATAAHAQTTLRIATPAPEGTSWSRQIRAFKAAVEHETGGQVRLKLYFGGIAGGEREVGERIAREQLDGTFSGGMLCMRLAPTLRVTRVLGLFRDRGEVSYVLSHLESDIENEFRRSGFYYLGMFAVGPSLVFLRRPVHTLAGLKATPLWTWNEDNTLVPGLKSAGFNVVPASLEDAAKLYDAGKVDGFIAQATSALVFQWSARAKYLLPLPLAALNACVIVSQRALDQLPTKYAQIVRDAAARELVQMDESSRLEEDKLLSGLFAKQGVVTLPVPPAMRTEFANEARLARERISEQLLPKPLLNRVLSLLADYRAEHRADR